MVTGGGVDDDDVVNDTLRYWQWSPKAPASQSHVYPLPMMLEHVPAEVA